MADAFSLAVNIFTLLEFGRKLVILALKIRKDGKDAISRISSLDLTSQDLSKIAGELGQSRHSTAAQIQDSADERIRKLAERCTEVALQLQGTIRSLGIDDANRKTGRAMVRAFKFKWKEPDILAFQSEIEDLRSELMLNMIIWLRTGMMKSLVNQDRMIQEFSEIQVRVGSHDGGLKERLDYLIREHEGFVQQIVEILSSNATSVVGSNSHIRPEAHHLEMDLMSAMQSTPRKMEDDYVSRLKVSPSRLVRVRNQFINIFRYDSMFDREAGVAEAHPDTLKWIFKEPSGETHAWDSFTQWLESQDQLYWITGKMGSGKSTLMKYISEVPPTSTASRERRCTPYLLRWAKNQPLFIATFYFWAGSNEETKIQTSVEGLYRTLFTQILEVYPEAAPIVSPRRWEDLCLFNKESTPLGIAEVKNTLTKAIEYVSSIAKVCLFVDGLDEVEGDNEDLRSLVTWIKSLAEIPQVKLCVASRPWRVFEDELQDRPHLLMEDFNYEDIQQYVWRRFHDDPNFKARKQMDTPFCEQLLDDLITKAEGVFLWVHLVCTRLLQAMSNGELVGELRKTLNALPVEMEKLYGHILDNLDHKDHAAKYFLLLQACLGRSDALMFSFADDIDDDKEFSLNLPKEPLTDSETQYRVTELKKRLNSRCRGLLTHSIEELEMTAHSSIGTVQYCHRSAKDYLTIGSIREKLMDMLNAPFDTHLRLCSAHLARSKCCPSVSSDLKWHPSIYECVEHAAKVTRESNGMIIRILDNLDPDFKAKPFVDNVHFGPYPWFGGNLLSYTVVLGVREYVKPKVEQGRGCLVKTSSAHAGYDPNLWGLSGHVRDKKKRVAERIVLKDFFISSQNEEVEWPLLLDAFLAGTQPNPEIISLLLENGANPYLPIRQAEWERSAWDFVSVRLRESSHNKVSMSPGEKEAWVNSLCLLLLHGLKPNRAEVQFLRSFIGYDMIQARKVPYLGRYREFISQHMGLIYDWIKHAWEHPWRR